MFYLNLSCRPSDLQFIQRLQGQLVPLAGIWMDVCDLYSCLVYNHDGRRYNLQNKNTLRLLNCRQTMQSTQYQHYYSTTTTLQQPRHRAALYTGGLSKAKLLPYTQFINPEKMKS